MVLLLLLARVIREMNSEQRVQEVVASPLGSDWRIYIYCVASWRESDGGGRISPRIKSGLFGRPCPKILGWN
jgi:hypothetical protein